MKRIPQNFQKLWVDTHSLQFAKAMGTIMCGKENSHKAKIGLYSIEFLPMNWLIDPNPN